MSVVGAERVVDVLVVGAGPAGAAAAIHAADAGMEVLLIDAAVFPRDKTCGDGLTPRAIHSLSRLGLAEEITGSYHNLGLKLRGFGGSVTAPWPDGHYGKLGSAMARREFDHLLVRTAVERGAELWEDASATTVQRTGQRVDEVTVVHAGVEKRIRARWVLVADGVRSTFGKLLGRQWHRGEVYGIAARSYCETPQSTEPWIHSDVELLDADGVVQPGYGWIFPLGDGRVNLGCGALSTDARPAKVNTKKLLSHYAAQKRDEWQLGPEQDVTSALLPMGGAVSNVAGSNWLLIGDAAALVNPLNGEGIDYGLESAEMAVALLREGRDLTLVWPHVLRETYGEAFLLARTAARLLTYSRFLPVVGPLGLRGPVGAAVMPAAARLMGNLITDEDRDLIARVWRLAGGAVSRVRRDTPLWSRTA
ncbi:MAG: geranylgeranyl reductase family protein [Corynebacterium sp.]|uniref:geranylgeranyl reductase family protein n=1 Tax=Corynebacterium sp. TaxID=1720 RepID=UPI0026DED0D0|nr:geranylgeranyl reductase family protein [Corynebacterium sp.]MDO5671209.1 geranylgeranyl reductase family protein [Corynebacterium sp.]